MTRRGSRIGRGDRGAGALEYALAAGLLLVALVGGLQWVQSAGESALDRQSDNLDYTSGGGGVPSTTTGGSSSGGSPTDTQPPDTQPPDTQPPDTQPPATVAPSTTTTAAPTTTTSTTTPSPSWPESGLAVNGFVVSREGSNWRPKPTISWSGPSRAELQWSTTVTYENGTTGPGTSGSYWMDPGQSTIQGGVGVYALTGKPSDRVVEVTLTITKVSTNTNPSGWNWQTFTVTGPTASVDAP